MNNELINNLSITAGRILMSIIFIMAGINKIGGYEGTQGYMESVGVPGMLLPAVIVVEIIGGLAILIGFKARLGALLLAGFTVVATILFHNNLGDQMQSILFMKNLAIIGGLLYLFANGAGKWSIDKE